MQNSKNLTADEKKAVVAALREYLENGEWFKTEHAGYVTQKGVFESYIEKIEATEVSNDTE